MLLNATCHSNKWIWNSSSLQFDTNVKNFKHKRIALVIPALAVSFCRACKNMASTAAATSTFVQLGGIMLILLMPRG